MSTVIDREQMSWQARWHLECWDPEQTEWAKRQSGLVAPSGAEMRRLLLPEREVEGVGNILVNAGIQRLEDLLIGAGGQAYTATFARIGTGNGSTAAAASNTDLAAAAGSANRWFQAMDATFPSRSSQTISFKSTFGTADGNYVWAEWGVDQGGAGTSTSSAVVGAPLLNRKVEALGTKAAGATWAFTVTITIS